MNPNVRRFVNDSVIPKKDIIINRNQALDWVIEETIPDFLVQRLEDIKILFLLGRDNTLLKIIPVFIGEILMSTIIAGKARYQEELSEVHQQYLSKDTKTILAELKSLKLLKESDYQYCLRYSSEKWLEILRKLKEEEQIKAEVEGAFKLLQNNAYILASLSNLPIKEEYEYLSTLPKSKKFKLSFSDSVDQEKIDKIFKSLPIIKSWQINDKESSSLQLNLLLELSGMDVYNMLSPALNEEFYCEPYISKVTAAIVLKDNKVLLAQRKADDIHSSKWEFPGGKIEDGETPEECLAREMKEEFQVEAEIGDFFSSSIYNYEYGTIELLAYSIVSLQGELVPTVHSKIEWADICELNKYQLLPADIPIAEKLKQELTSKQDSSI